MYCSKYLPLVAVILIAGPGVSRARCVSASAWLHQVEDEEEGHAVAVVEFRPAAHLLRGGARLMEPADEEAGLIAQSLSDARVEILALCAEIRGALSSLCNDMDSGFTRLGERIDALASEVRHAKQELIRRLENA